MENLILITAGVLVGLNAGLFYAFSVAVVPGLRNIKAKAHILVMQSINHKIENPIFFISFFGPLILLPLATYQHREMKEFIWLLVATIIEFITVGITGLGNVPINKKLDEVDVEKISDEKAEKVRVEFQKPFSKWMVLHHLRTALSVVVMVILFITFIL